MVTVVGDGWPGRIGDGWRNHHLDHLLPVVAATAKALDCRMASGLFHLVAAKEAVAVHQEKGAASPNRARPGRKNPALRSTRCKSVDTHPQRFFTFALCRSKESFSLKPSGLRSGSEGHARANPGIDELAARQLQGFNWLGL